MFLKQSTAIEIKVGPFVDNVDGFTPETGLTITSAELLLNKNEGDWAAKNEGTSLVHESNGWYRCLLNATDTNTLGILRYQVAESGALPVWGQFMVVPANVYDSLFSTDFLQVDLAQWLGTAAATPTVAGVPEVDATHWLGAAAPSLVSGRMDSSVGAMAADVLTASAIAAGAIDAAALAADMDGYAGKLWVIDDNGGTTDRYIMIWFKNGAPITTGITSPTLQVVKASDGTDLVASGAMTEIGSLGLYKKDEATNRIVSGASYVAKATATIGGSARTWYQPVGRDSE